MKRRQFLQITLPLVVADYSSTEAATDPEISFGVIADPQFADADPKGRRHYRNSLRKLDACIDAFNREELAFVTTLGDLIDRDLVSFDAVMPLYEKLKHPHFPICGNHDFYVADEDKGKVLAKMGLDQAYYSKSIGGWRMVFLDGMDVSILRQPKNDPASQLADKYMRELANAGRIQAVEWNGGVGPEQITWLERQLEEAMSQKQRVIIFNHFPIIPEGIHNLWNAEELVALIEKNQHVVAYMNGHYHAGRYATHQSCHFMNFKGMVETENDTAYAVVRCFADRIEIQGYGLEPDRKLGKL